jgi:hypothetical protein
MVFFSFLPLSAPVSPLSSPLPLFSPSPLPYPLPYPLLLPSLLSPLTTVSVLRLSKDNMHKLLSNWDRDNAVGEWDVKRKKAREKKRKSTKVGEKL